MISSVFEQEAKNSQEFDCGSLDFERAAPLSL
jgi:hypothetical protein